MIADSCEAQVQCRAAWSCLELWPQLHLPAGRLLLRDAMDVAGVEDDLTGGHAHHLRRIEALVGMPNTADPCQCRSDCCHFAVPARQCPQVYTTSHQSMRLFHVARLG